MSVLIFANPYSGRRRNDLGVGRLTAALESRGLEAEVIWERHDRAATVRRAHADRPLRCVIAAGGDGSVADVINDMQVAGLLGQTPFATWPVGTENLFAKELGFVCKPAALAEAIERGRTRPVDLGVARPADRQRLFTLMTSVGFDADVVRRVDVWRNDTPDGSLRRVDQTKYVPHVLGSMRCYRFPTIRLETDEGDVVEGGQAYVFNLPRYGGGLRTGRHAVIDDGLLDWVVFTKPGLVNLVGYHVHTLFGSHLRCGTVRHGRARRVTLRAADGIAMPAQIDGDPAGGLPIDVEVRPGALSVIDMAASAVTA